jgi:excisionase family DNA binding protein
MSSTITGAAVPPPLQSPPRLVWLTAKEAAQQLKVATRTVLAWARDGKLKGHTLSGTERHERHVWRFLQSDLDDMLISSSVQPHSQRVRV